MLDSGMALGITKPIREGPLDDASAIEILPERDPHVYGFTIKTTANPFFHRVTPLRDPSQPRFWCVVVFRCAAGGLPDKTELPWISRRQLRREELADTMQAIRDDPVAWLAEAGNAELREWILTPTSPGTPDEVGVASNATPGSLAASRQTTAVRNQRLESA
jgi:hypothetical protein